MTIRAEVEALEFDIDRSRRYHSRRMAFFDSLHRWIMAFVVFGGSATFAALTSSHPIIPKLTAAAVTLAAVVDLICGFSQKARTHDFLYRRWCDLAATIAECADPTDEYLRRWKARRLLIESDEPPVYRALDVACHNDAIQGWGSDESAMCPLHWFKRITKHLHRWEGWDFPSYRDLGMKPPRRAPRSIEIITSP